MFKFQNTKRPI